MSIFKIIAVGMIGALIAAALKSYRPEFGIATAAVTGIAVMLMMTDGLFSAVKQIEETVEKTGIDTAYFKITVKVIGISYITQFASELCRDAGESAVASKIDSAGRLCVMVMTIPIISGFLDIIIGMLSLL